MISAEELHNLVRAWLAEQVPPGERAGGSGHLSAREFTIDRISEPVLYRGKWRVTFAYSVYTLSEFTAEPDNPPRPARWEATAEIDPATRAITVVKNNRQ